MSVLARELDSYQRALDMYQRQMNSYNRAVDQYRNTLVYDANGNIVITGPGDEGTIMAVGPDGQIVNASGKLEKYFNQYGQTAIPDGHGYRMLRQYPVEENREVVKAVKGYLDSDTGKQYYYTDAYRGDDYTRNYLGAEWQLDETLPGARDSEGNIGPPTYVFSRDASKYLEAPEEWTKTFNRKAPDATAGQVRRMGMPSLAEIEGGLIGEVMKGSGVRQGVPVYRPKKM